MKELSEGDIQRIVGGIPSSNLVLFCPGLQGRGSTLIDRSQYANNGTISGASWVRLPSGLWVLSFDGINDTVDVAKSASLNISGQALTMKVWAYSTGGDVERTILIKGGTAGWTHKWGLTWGTEAHKPHALINTGSEVGANTTNTYVDNIWWHFVATYDGANILLYLNGVSDNGAPQTGNIASVDEDLWFGILNSQLRWKGKLGIPELHTEVWDQAKITRSFTRERHLFGV